MVYYKHVPRLRFQRAPAEKREVLLDAASNEFAAHGYEDSSINRILLAAGFSKGSFYYYFDDKADLAGAVLERWAARQAALFDDWPETNTPEDFWAASAALLESSTTQLREEPQVTTDAMMRLGTALSRHPEVRERMLSGVVTAMMKKVVAIWTRGQEIGAIRDDLPVEKILALVQDAKLTLVRLVMPSDRAATMEEIEAFTRLHFDLVRRVSEKR
jgi:AcrR family transcriptional regulator